MTGPHIDQPPSSYPSYPSYPSHPVAPYPPPPRKRPGWLLPVLIGVGVAVVVCMGASAFVAWNVGRSASQALRPEYDVTLTAEVAEYTPIYSDDTSVDYTVVLVTITNNDDSDLSVSPWDFSVIDAGGTRHASELFVDANELGSVTLGPGQTTSGTVAVAGGVVPALVSYEPFLAPEPFTVDVTGG